MFLNLIKNDIFKSNDLRQKTFINASRTVNALSKTSQIPTQVSTLLDLGVKGKARLNLDINNIDKLNKTLKNVATKIAYALVIGTFALALAIILAALLFSQQHIMSSDS